MFSIKEIAFLLLATILVNTSAVSGSKVAMNGVFEIEDSVYVLNRTNIEHFIHNNELVVGKSLINSIDYLSHKILTLKFIIF